MLCCCYQRSGRLLHIQNEFSYVASVMNSLHGLFYLRRKHNSKSQINSVIKSDSIYNMIFLVIKS